MEIQFNKYQGTGNDFIIIDNRGTAFPKNDTRLIEWLCDRKFGIGADGLILLEDDKFSDFSMVYYNSDGNESSMCGNGGRCVVAFARKMGVINLECSFMAIDGLHYAKISDDNLVSLQMKDVDEISSTDTFTFLDTGSPHHVELTDDLESLNIKQRGAEIRYSERYSANGTNVNFVKQKDESTFSVRTYERGVEDETLSCGTGVTAVAIAMHALGRTKSNNVMLNVEGGILEVAFEENHGKYDHIFLKGPATFVFQGIIQTN